MRTDLRYIELDEFGWAQRAGSRWKPNPRSRTNGRSGLPWTAAEDAMLLERCQDAASIGYANPTIKAAAVAHGRSTCSIATRLCALRAGERLAKRKQDEAMAAFQRFRVDTDPVPDSAAPDASPPPVSDAK